jgi:hypothetical protein
MKPNTLPALLAICAVALFPPASADTETINVPAGSSLQDAINRARPGDVLVLAQGATYEGNFVLPARSGDQYITIRTASADDLPRPGQRVLPAHAPKLAKLKSPSNEPVVRTAAGAHHWRLQLLELLPTRNGAGDIVRLGDGSGAQNDLSQVPHDLVVDRCYIHGDPVAGQKRGSR